MGFWLKLELEYKFVLSVSNHKGVDRQLLTRESCLSSIWNWGLQFDPVIKIQIMRRWRWATPAHPVSKHDLLSLYFCGRIGSICKKSFTVSARGRHTITHNTSTLRVLTCSTTENEMLTNQRHFQSIKTLNRNILTRY